MITDRLKEASIRTDGYLCDYGIEVVWSLTPIGIKLKAQSGANKITKYVDYDEMRDSRTCPLERTEKEALRGLSS